MFDGAAERRMARRSFTIAQGNPAEGLADHAAAALILSVQFDGQVLAEFVIGDFVDGCGQDEWAET